MLKTSLLATAATASGAPVAAVAAGAPATRIRLLPAGATTLRDGRKINLAASAMQSVLDLTRAFLGSADMTIDYDHQSERLAASGGTAPAAGWVETASLTAEPDGIWGVAAWTDRAAAALAAREWRYLSPTFFHDKAGNVLALKSAALVNIPAIDALAALAATQNAADAAGQETMMDPTAIAKALGLAETATTDEIVAAIDAMKAGGVAMAATVAGAATALGLAATATLGEVATAATATATVDPTKWAPIGLVATLSQRLAQLETATLAKAATDAIDAATAAGKLPPADRQWGLDLYAKSPELFATYVTSAATLTGGALKLDAAPKFDGTAATLDAAELAMCGTLGLSPAAFAAAKPKDA